MFILGVVDLVRQYYSQVIGWKDWDVTIHSLTHSSFLLKFVRYYVLYAVMQATFTSLIIL